MKARKITEDIFHLGAIDWDRRMFDALIPLPHGTSYNAYLIKGSNKTALIDTVEPSMKDDLLFQLNSVKTLDYIIVHHAEQDHAGALPYILSKYPEASVLTTSQGKDLVINHVGIDPDKIRVVADGEKLDLGNKTLECIYTPWIHWPETMCTYSHEDKILFSCELFGSHLATTDLYAYDQNKVYEAAKRYYAEIVMPFRKTTAGNIEKLAKYDIALIAPGHGPIYDQPSFIISAYTQWLSDKPKNQVLIPYVSMHGSTEKMAKYLVSALAERYVGVQPFDLAVTDIGQLAMSLVDAATLVIGTPAFHLGPHPIAFFATHLANILRPKVVCVSIIGSYGWGSSIVETMTGLIPDLNVEVIPPVLCKGEPKEKCFQALDILADTILSKHKQYGLF
ncbi:MAG: FprA family A-type flavoprotein [Candidatus Auribacter fodinae]|jgi:flavorubredoxin|uniref:FprA family A-type flavoprotein n=1 Tax=Candidatus Auribacter fodinae TaxID=2093366 RepID=A0A3A4R7W6_9BACT|nr:MAG: FprA family A-type flavoprotein [Candidatus Auribacter fodinae]